MTTSSFKVHEYDHPLPQDLSQGGYCYPPKNLIFGKIGLGIVWSKKETPWKSSGALIISKIKFFTEDLGYYCTGFQKMQEIPIKHQFSEFPRISSRRALRAATEK